MQRKHTFPLPVSYRPISRAARTLPAPSAVSPHGAAANLHLPSFEFLDAIAAQGAHQRGTTDARSRALFEQNCAQQRLPSLLPSQATAAPPSPASSSRPAVVRNTYNAFLLPVDARLWVDVYTDYKAETGKRHASMVVKGKNEEVQTCLIQRTSNRPDRKSVNFRFYPQDDPNLIQPHLISDSFSFEIPVDTQKIGFNGKRPVTLTPRE
jgi:hypothetical protein